MKRMNYNLNGNNASQEEPEPLTRNRSTKKVRLNFRNFTAHTIGVSQNESVYSRWRAVGVAHTP